MYVKHLHDKIKLKDFGPLISVFQTGILHKKNTFPQQTRTYWKGVAKYILTLLLK